MIIDKHSKKGVRIKCLDAVFYGKGRGADGQERIGASAIIEANTQIFRCVYMDTGFKQAQVHYRLGGRMAATFCQ